jgi:hypothetical protein
VFLRIPIIHKSLNIKLDLSIIEKGKFKEKIHLVVSLDELAERRE